MHPLVEHLKTVGAVFSGEHSPAEILALEARLGIQLPDELLTYYSAFGNSVSTHEAMWNFYSVEASIEATENYRSRHEKITGEVLDPSSMPLVAFCDAMIELPIYLVVAEAHHPLYGKIIGAQEDKGWIIDGGLVEFLRLFARDAGYAILCD